MRGERTHSVILEKAVELASLRGLEQLSLAELAAAAKMSKSGLFAHFDSKEELQLATIDRGWEIFESYIHSPRDGEPQGELDALLERWLAFYECEILPGGCFFITAAVEFASQPGAVRDALASTLRQELATLESAVEGAREAGAFHGDADASQLAFELHSILLNTNALHHVHQDRVAFDRARTGFKRVLRADGPRG